MDDKTKLVNLYVQKGELITELEIMQAQLQNVNKRIIQMRNRQIQQKDTEKKPDDSEDK